METLSLKELLRTTIPDPNRFEAYWGGTSKTSFSLSKVCSRHYFNSLEDFDELLAEYLNEYPMDCPFMANKGKWNKNNEIK